MKLTHGLHHVTVGKDPLALDPEGEDAVRARRVLVHLGLPHRAPLGRSRHELEDILGALDGFLGEVHDVDTPPLLRGGARVLHQAELLLLLLQRGKVVEVHVAE